MAQHPEGAAHAHADEEMTLPHGSKWPIIAAMGVGLIYVGLIAGWPILAGGLAIVIIAMAGIITEDARWWNGNVGTGMRNGWWGVLFFLGTEVMLFSALFATYFNHRAAAGAGFGLNPEGQFYLADAVVKTGINTVILLLSGVTCHFAHTAIRRGDQQKLKLWLVATIALGAVFIGGQVVEYLSLASEGLRVQSGTFGATFYMLTGTHGAHVLGGLGVLSICAWRAFQGQFDQKRHVAVEVSAIYWHFVDVVWVLLYAVVYLRVL
ncbi:MAG: cytochrome c oxidase subunit 3 [Halobacteriales archaeon]|nr:cytochrome c oxidase subunit 3 [Halobacteriales archaeon]